MTKINTYLIIVIFILVGCSKKTYTVLPDDTLNDKNNNTDNTKTNETVVLSEVERNKIASIVGVKPKKIINDKLYAFVNEWLNVPYIYGGEDKNGIDCSAITQDIFKDVYAIDLPRTSAEMFWSDNISRFKKKRYLKEGDLVFFRIDKEKTISHVGIYLQNNKFFSSNVSAGVEIADLNSPYWMARYVASGRVITKKNVVE